MQSLLEKTPPAWMGCGCDPRGFAVSGQLASEGRLCISLNASSCTHTHKKTAWDCYTGRNNKPAVRYKIVLAVPGCTEIGMNKTCF